MAKDLYTKRNAHYNDIVNLTLQDNGTVRIVYNNKAAEYSRPSEIAEQYRKGEWKAFNTKHYGDVIYSKNLCKFLNAFCVEAYAEIELLR